MDNAWQASWNCFSRRGEDSSLFWNGLTTTTNIVEATGKYATYIPRPSDTLG